MSGSSPFAAPSPVALERCGISCNVACGPPTGRQWVNRGTAHCLVQGGKVVEEWVMRDEFAVLQDLGLDPVEVAGQLAKRSPVLGEAVQAEGSGAFAGTFPDPVRLGITGERPRRFEAECGRFEAECGMIAERFDRVWNGRYMDEVRRTFAEPVVVQSVRLRRAMGVALEHDRLRLTPFSSPSPVLHGRGPG